MAISWLVLVSAVMANGVEDFLHRAKEMENPLAERAAKFLVKHMPQDDLSKLEEGFLMEHLELALDARKRFPWALAVPEERFLNDVLPYACLDEPREVWRRRLLEISAPIVSQASTSSEAAQALNRDLFKVVGVHYHTGRKRPNQGPLESMTLGKASCTGLSVLLVSACRSVGIPARVVGTPRWSNGTGNHTWVEIWDGDWHFTGADEFSPHGLNQGWFVENASLAVDDPPEHGIYASSWQPLGQVFPLAWNPDFHGVQAERVTSRYAKNKSADVVSACQLAVRWYRKPSGERLSSAVKVLGADFSLLGEGRTRAETADLNDMPVFPLPNGTVGWVESDSTTPPIRVPFGPLTSKYEVLEGGNGTEPSKTMLEISDWLGRPWAERPTNPPSLREGLTRREEEWVRAAMISQMASHLKQERMSVESKKRLSAEGKVMRWKEITFGESPPDGRSLWISLHGGGNAPAKVNDAQWNNQIRLYQPKEGIYLAPRAPTDTWNLWHEAHIDPMMQRIIEHFVLMRDVNPEKIFLLGYSAGGDGVWQLAPRMADRFAAAAMMAGHPNEAKLDSLAQLPFAILVGAEDAAYQRNEVAAAKAEQLNQLAAAKPGCYTHFFRLYPHTGHWMNLQDAEVLPWMAEFRRVTWPKSLVWMQDDVVHRRFYWIKLPEGHQPKAGDLLRAEVRGQEIVLDGIAPSGTEIRLSDRLLDLDVPLRVTVNGREVFQGKANRRASVIWQSLSERYDPPATAAAVVLIP